MSKVKINLACGDYEIIRALKDGDVVADGIDLNVLTDMDSTTRHWRFIRNRDFEAAEVGSCAYFLAKDNDFPFYAIPVFPHRRFRHGFIFINANAGISKPSDLIGRRIGVKAFQTSAVVWERGILEHEYGVPHRSIDWFAEIDEDVDFTPPPGLRLHRLRHDQSVETMVAEGELDAVIHSSLIKPILNRDPRVKRLFPNYKEEERLFYEKTGIFPIMHVIGIKKELIDRDPWIAINLFHAFNRSKDKAMVRMENPRIAPLAWYREAWEEQFEVLGPDPWEYGLGDANRRNLEMIMKFLFEAGMTRKHLTVEDCFLDVSQGRKRGVEFRI